MFAGYLLGNPVTGKSEIQPDRTVSWSLQDDSGAYQHFSGFVAADRKSGRFRQTDPGGSQSGVMARTADGCTAASLRKKYEFALSGSSVPMASGEVASTIEATGLMQSDDHGNFKLTLQGASAAAIDVTVHVETDCTAPVQVKLRGILVNDGKEILAIRTDPGWTAPARLTAP